MTATKRALLILLLVVSTATAMAQSGKITATIVDAATKEPIVGAVVTITPKDDTEAVQYATSAYKGGLTHSGLKFGQYDINIAFLGYSSYEGSFVLESAVEDLGTIALKEGLQIETITKEAHAIRASQRGDTITYNADAFKVTRDADVEGLLKKMPGLTVENGTVEAQGEQVKKIFVDGKEFFGEDVTMAIKSLPAEAVDKIEVVNKLSDDAEFSGMDDGEGYKALNIVTRSNMRQGVFGNVYAGYAYEPDSKIDNGNKYLVGSNLNIFKNDSRLTILTLFNDVNQTNFSFEDILGVSGGKGAGGGRQGGAGAYMMPQQSGVASVNAIGLNYSNVWGKKDNVKLQADYFFNNTNTTNIQTTDRWYVAPYKIDTLSSVATSDTEAYNHRFNAHFDWKISDNQSLMIRPSFSYQSNDPLSTTLGWQYGQSGYSRTDNFSDATYGGYNLRTNAAYRLRLGKAGRTLTLSGMVSQSDRNSSTNSWSNTLGFLPTEPTVDPLTGEWDATDYTDLQYLYEDDPTKSFGLRGNLSYTEPIGKHTQLSLQYRLSYDNQQSDASTYILPSSSFSIEGIAPDPALSVAYESDYITHRVGPGISYAKDKTRFVANVYYQNSTLDGQVVNSTDEKISQSFNDFTYFAMAQININRENSLRAYLFSSTNNPSVTDLQSIYNVSNAQNITRGNPELDPSYNQQLRLHYTNTNLERGRTFMFTVSGTTSNGYNGLHTIQNPGSILLDGVLYNPNFYSQTVNLDGYWNVSSQISYGFPISFIKSNLNLMAGVNYNQTPSMLGGMLDTETGIITGGDMNEARNLGYTFRSVLGSNISENVDFTLSWSGNYNEATNTLDESGEKNQYFNHTAQADMKFVMPLGFTLTAAAAYTQYLGFTNDYDDSYLLCSAYIGKKIFKSKLGEIQIGVNDIFNQNQSFVRTTGTGYSENVTNSVLGRYVMAKFTYNLRLFKGASGVGDFKSSGGGGRPPHGGGGGRGGGGGIPMF